MNKSIGMGTTTQTILTIAKFEDEMPNYTSLTLPLCASARQLLQVGEPAQRTGLPLREKNSYYR
jgi:hypothetical protein